MPGGGNVRNLSKLQGLYGNDESMPHTAICDGHLEEVGDFLRGIRMGDKKYIPHQLVITVRHIRVKGLGLLLKIRLGHV